MLIGEGEYSKYNEIYIVNLYSSSNIVPLLGIWH